MRADRPVDRNQPTRLQSATGALLTLGLLLPLLAHAYLGKFSRYVADDYCVAHNVESQGIWATQVSFYLGWSGRFASTFFISVADLLGAGLPRFLPGLAVAVWLALLAWCVRSLAPRGATGPGSWCQAWFVASLALCGTIGTFANAAQRLYWQNNLLTHTAPLLGWALLLGLLAPALRSGRTTPLGLVGTALVAFTVGGFSEMATAAQLALLSAGAVAVWLSGAAAKNRARVTALAAAFAGTTAAAITMVLAPGNDVRRLSFPQPTDLARLLPRAHGALVTFLADAATSYPFHLALALGLPAIWLRFLSPLAKRVGERELRTAGGLPWLAALPLMGYLVLLFTFLPVSYAMSEAPPPPRALIIPRHVLIGLLIVWGWISARAWAGGARGRSPIPALAAGLAAAAITAVGLLYGPLDAALEIRSHRREYRTLAQQWDVRDREVRANSPDPDRTVRVARLPWTNDLSQIGPDPEEWINRCYAYYYGLGAVIGVPLREWTPMVVPLLRPLAGSEPRSAGTRLLNGHASKDTGGFPIQVRFGGWDPEETRPQMHPSGQGTVETELLDGLRTGTGDPNWECLLWTNPSGYTGFEAHVNLDLGRVRNVDRVEIWTASPYGDIRIDRVDLWMSSDGVAFDAVDFTVNRRPHERSEAFALAVDGGGRAARFLRLGLVQFDGSGQAMQVCEVQVYGDGSQP